MENVFLVLALESAWVLVCGVYEVTWGGPRFSFVCCHLPSPDISCPPTLSSDVFLSSVNRFFTVVMFCHLVFSGLSFSLASFCKLWL